MMIVKNRVKTSTLKRRILLEYIRIIGFGGGLVPVGIVIAFCFIGMAITFGTIYLILIIVMGVIFGNHLCAFLEELKKFRDQKENYAEKIREIERLSVLSITRQ